jgi:hypothetical protein
MRVADRLLAITGFFLAVATAPALASGYGHGVFLTPVFGPAQFGVEVFTESVELDEIETEAIFSDGRRRDVNLDDVDRERAGVRFRFGSPELSGLFVMFGERMDYLRDEETSSIGIGLGVIGRPRLAEIDREVWLVASYRGQLNSVFGEVDVPVFDARTGSFLGDQEEDFGYVELESEVGFGVEVNGLSGVLGVYATGIDGEVEIGSRELDLFGSNAGVFFNLGFEHPDSWFIADIRGIVGDVTGVAVSVGVKF